MVPVSQWGHPPSSWCTILKWWLWVGNFLFSLDSSSVGPPLSNRGMPLIFCRRRCTSDLHIVHHCVLTPTRLSQYKTAPSCSADSNAPFLTCGMFCVFKNINHHVLSSCTSHFTDHHVSHDWQSCVNNAALSVLTALQSYSSIWCECAMLFTVDFSFLVVQNENAYFF